MNIKEAKEQVKLAMTAYFSKDEFGYEIPIEEQRPVFLMGPPGIGKTAIMAQVAQELGVGLVSYSMTHHTRQSALGLPSIVHKNYDGYECDVTEYTMSEIIASVYDMMESTGVKEGILFLDEINCVSETLAPIMLQFLQYKVFGRHRVPDGWIVVTAGNPPEYNNSVREFDIVTWDRLKRIDIEPDFDAWKEYAYQRNVHPAILTYLEVKKGDFYKVESTVDGRHFVTARGWEDLSRMIRVCEKHGLTVDQKLVSQYLQDPKIARNFAIYYDLFNKYRGAYQTERILAGTVSEEVKAQARAARFDERLALLGLILDAITASLKEVMVLESANLELLAQLKSFRAALAFHRDARPAHLLEQQRSALLKKLDSGRKAGSLSPEEQHKLLTIRAALGELAEKIGGIANPGLAFQTVKSVFDSRIVEMQQKISAGKEQLSHVFAFCEEVFADGQELLILVTELTVNVYTSKFISSHGCPEYFAHNRELLFYETQQDLLAQLDGLDLDEE